MPWYWVQRRMRVEFNSVNLCLQPSTDLIKSLLKLNCCKFHLHLSILFSQMFVLLRCITIATLFINFRTATPFKNTEKTNANAFVQTKTKKRNATRTTIRNYGIRNCALVNVVKRSLVLLDIISIPINVDAFQCQWDADMRKILMDFIENIATVQMLFQSCH